MTCPRSFLLAATALLLAPAALAQPTPASVPAQPQTRGLTAEEAAALIAKIADAQARLKNGEKAYFELLSGAPASYPMTRTAPRDAFLRLPLTKTFSVERKATDNKLWQPYRIIVLPDGPGKLLWDVEVVLGINGQIERIAMLYRSPAPF
jgi:lipoprotein-anchoring transpeptidase ErfK/SrfK